MVAQRSQQSKLKKKCSHHSDVMALLLNILLFWDYWESFRDFKHAWIFVRPEQKILSKKGKFPPPPPYSRESERRKKSEFRIQNTFRYDQWGGPMRSYVWCVQWPRSLTEKERYHTATRLPSRPPPRHSYPFFSASTLSALFQGTWGLQPWSTIFLQKSTFVPNAVLDMSLLPMLVLDPVRQ